MTKMARLNFDGDTISQRYPDWLINTSYEVFAELSEEHDISVKDLWDMFKRLEHFDVFQKEFDKHNIKIQQYDLRPFPSWGIQMSDETRIECILKYSDDPKHK